MNNIQIKGVESTLSQVVLEDIKYLKEHLDDVLNSSDQTVIKNLINETEFLLEQAKDDSKTYQERYVVFRQLTEAWFGAWEHYKNDAEAVDFIRSIDHLTNYSTAYYYLFFSLSLINEEKTGQYRDDLERTVSGFLWLSEIVDIFFAYFSVSELKQIYYGAKNAISVSDRNMRQYFESDLELSNLVTQLRAYSSLIVLKIEEHISKADLTQNDDWLTQDTPADAVMTVTGELIRIDFDKRIVVLRYPPTHEEIKCIYLEDLEDSIIENRRQKIQATGQFTLDADGHPIKSTNVTRVEPVDLSPILIREILWHNKKLRFKSPFLLSPQMDDTEQLYVVEEPEIGLHVFSYTREDLIHEINEELAMLWEEYAVTKDELAKDARTLQAKLLATLEEVKNAAS